MLSTAVIIYHVDVVRLAKQGNADAGRLEHQYFTGAPGMPNNNEGLSRLGEENTLNRNVPSAKELKTLSPALRHRSNSTWCYSPNDHILKDLCLDSRLIQLLPYFSVCLVFIDAASQPV